MDGHTGFYPAGSLNSESSEITPVSHSGFSSQAGDATTPEDKKQVTKIHGDNYRSLCSKDCFGAYMASMVRWEVTIRAIVSSGIDVKMGFIDAERIDKFDHGNRVGYFKDQVALWIENDKNPKILAHGSTSELSESLSGSNPEEGDRIRLDFNFKTRKVTAFFNDEDIGYITCASPKSVYLAISLYWEGTSVETTLD